MRTLRVPGNSGVVSSIAWEGFGLRIVLAIDSNVLFANIQPDYIWSYFNNTIVLLTESQREMICASHSGTPRSMKDQ